jgi:HisJ family histidinol phosphate phosphatase
MPFSHHSHSGQFCEGHAKDSLEAVIQTAIRQKMSVYALTEHMPRAEEDLYPEEVCKLPRVPVQDLYPWGNGQSKNRPENNEYRRLPTR